jgi:hypothetical protein
MSQHDTLLAAFETYKAENEKFIEKGIKASAARARKACWRMQRASQRNYCCKRGDGS